MFHYLLLGIFFHFFSSSSYSFCHFPSFRNSSSLIYFHLLFSPTSFLNFISSILFSLFTSSASLRHLHPLLPLILHFSFIYYSPFLSLIIPFLPPSSSFPSLFLVSSITLCPLPSPSPFLYFLISYILLRRSLSFFSFIFAYLLNSLLYIFLSSAFIFLFLLLCLLHFSTTSPFFLHLRFFLLLLLRLFFHIFSFPDLYNCVSEEGNLNSLSSEYKANGCFIFHSDM